MLPIDQNKSSAPIAREIDKSFQPAKGDFLRTLDFPELDIDGNQTGRVWLEASYDAGKKNWVLWQKAIRKFNDPLTDTESNVLQAKALFEKTDFITAYDQMTTFEMAQKGLGMNALPGKTPAKLGGDYYKQFAWREGLMMSRSGRLYPVDENIVNSDNFFDQADIDAAIAFHARLKTEQFIPVPIVLPSLDWEKSYNADKARVEARLNVLYQRFGGDKNNYELGLQIVGQEAPEVLYAHMQRGFTPKIFENNAEQHFNILKAAIDRPQVDALMLLAQSGLSFYARFNDETPLELVLQQRRYSHLHVMLSRDNGELANYRDESDNSPVTMAIAMQDRQAFRMLYLEGLDYTHVDKAGMSLVHHGFENSFLAAIHAWLDEGLSIDQPIAGTGYTGLSIARRKRDQPLIDFALQNGANVNAVSYPEPETSIAAGSQQASDTATVNVQTSADPAFSIDLLNQGLTNAEIIALAEKHVAAGGSVNGVSSKNLSLFEICWKNNKADPAYDRRALIPALGKLGADATALLDDGTTALTRAVSGMTFDMAYFKAVAPFAVDVNAADANGNNVLHALQLNASETVSNSTNVALILKTFPALDINRANNDGYSNVNLAVRLNRSQTLKAFATVPDWNQPSKGGWSTLDVAFTSAAGFEKVTGAARADKIPATSEATRLAVLDLVERTVRSGTPDQKKSLTEVFNRQRPDGQQLSAVIAAEKTSPQIITRLIACGLIKPQP